MEGRKRFFFGPRIFFTGKGGRFQKSSLLEVWREGGGGEHFFSDRGFFYRELYWTKNFFTGRMEGFKSHLCLRFGGKEGRRKFFSDRGFFYREGGRFQKSSLLEVWRKGGGGKHFFLTVDFFPREGGRSFFGTQKK
jgi:hypothetical protein